MHHQQHLKAILLSILIIPLCDAEFFSNSIYCGQENCYEILGVTRDSSKVEISRKYRQLAKVTHPDLQRDVHAKEVAAEEFKRIANAYETLKDDEARAEYDYFLDNPDEFYANYYRYYRRRMAPKVDVRIVLVVTISIISAVQYYSRWQNYEMAIRSFMSVPKYRSRAMQIAQDEGLLVKHDRKAKTKVKLGKSEVDTVIKRILEDKMDIKGSYAKPSLSDILWIQLALFPWTLLKYIYWHLDWFYRHTLLKQPFNEIEKFYLIRKNLKMGQHQFDSQEDDRKREFLERELWIWENFEVWFEEEKENAKKQMADNNRYKQYRRYLKNHGVGRMTFDDS